MTQEDKQLLLKDLCARLPYGVNLYIEEPKKLPDNEHISVGFIGGYALNKEGCQDFLINDVLESLDNGSVVKPYLRPMSSMTEEEKKDFSSHIMNDKCDEDGVIIDVHDITSLQIYYYYFKDVIDWLLAHHFDYRGLIEKGLALKALKGMYK